MSDDTMKGVRLVSDDIMKEARLVTDAMQVHGVFEKIVLVNILQVCRLVRF